MGHPIRKCVECKQTKSIQGRGMCGSCYQKYRKSPEYVPIGRGIRVKYTPITVTDAPPIQLPALREATPVKRKYNKKEPIHQPSTDVTAYSELYTLKGLMFAVVDFIHGKLSSDNLLLLMKEHGYDT